MNELDNKWLDDIRNTMSDYSEPLPEDDWRALSASLDAKACPQISPRRGRNVSFAIRRIAVAAVFASFFSIWCYMPSAYEDLSIEDVAGNDELANNIGDVVASEIMETLTATTTSPAVHVASNTTPSQYVHSTQNNAEEVAIETEEVEYNEEIDIPDNAVIVNEPRVQEDGVLDEEKSENPMTMEIASANETTTENKTTDVAVEPHFPLNISSSNNTSQPLIASNTRRNEMQDAQSDRWSIGLHLGGNGVGLSSIGGQSGSFVDSGLASKGPGSDIEEGEPEGPEPPKDFEGPVAKPTLEDVVVDSDNHVSFSFGISFSKNLIGRLSVETGLVFTSMRSDIEMSLSGIKEQKLNYLGVPVGLRYNVVDNGKWTIYGLGEMVVERCISAQRGGEKLDMNMWQFSTIGAAGFQYRIGQHLGIYAEPGVKYYFDNNSEVPTIRSEHRCSFNMLFGVRFNY